MSEYLRVDACPCGAEFVREVTRSETRWEKVNGTVTADEHSFLQTIACDNGHTYEVHMSSNVSPQWILFPDRRGG